MSILAMPKIPGNDVVPSTQALPTLPYEKALHLTLESSSIEAYSRDSKALVSPDRSNYTHPFIAAAETAYAGHYPLVFSPDMIWLLIAQGFACHINRNAESLRSRFVKHADKLAICVERNDYVRGFAGYDWEEVFTEFSDQIRDHIGEVAHRAIVPIFSTTGIVERAAFEITLMDTMQSYFDCNFGFVCGIPWFALEGTYADWELLRANAADLARYDLEWWMPYLLPVLDEFVAASQGHPNRSFWENFVHCVSGQSCGENDTVTGFINNLFPYINDKDHQRKLLTADETYAVREAIQKDVSLIEDPDEYMMRLNQLTRRLLGTPCVSSKRNPCFTSLFVLSEEGSVNGLQADDFPSALSIAPVTFWGKNGTSYPMEFVAGFIGFGQDQETLAIRPEIGWAIVNKE